MSIRGHPISSSAAIRARLLLTLAILSVSCIFLFIRLGHYALWDDEANTALDGLSKEERFAKIGASIKQSRDARNFNLEKDWHIIAYLLTGDAKINKLCP